MHFSKSFQGSKRAMTIFFFCLGLFHKNSRITVLQGKVAGVSLIPCYHLHSLHRHLRHQPGNYCRKFTSAHSWQQESNQEPLLSEHKSLPTTLRALNYAPCFNRIDFVVIPSNIKLPCLDTSFVLQLCFMHDNVNHAIWILHAFPFRLHIQCFTKT